MTRIEMAVACSGQEGLVGLGGKSRGQLYLISLLAHYIKSEYTMVFDLIIHEIRVVTANPKRNSRGREEEIQDILCIYAYMYFYIHINDSHYTKLCL